MYTCALTLPPAMHLGYTCMSLRIPSIDIHLVSFSSVIVSLMASLKASEWHLSFCEAEANTYDILFAAGD